MNGRTCENLLLNGKTCGGSPYSWSVEHGDQVFCKACYDEFIKARDLAKNMLQNLATVAQQSPSKFEQASKQLAAILGGGK